MIRALASGFIGTLLALAFVLATLMSLSVNPALALGALPQPAQDAPAPERGVTRALDLEVVRRAPAMVHAEPRMPAPPRPKAKKKARKR